jgi:hypothetical protein
LENIAMASAARSKMKVKSLDYAIGSTLECAACLDLAAIKQLAASPAVGTEKQELSRILRMLIGLRKSWSREFVNEGQTEYAIGSQPAGADASVGEGWQRAYDKAYDKALSRCKRGHSSFHYPIPAAEKVVGLFHSRMSHSRSC